MRCDTVVMPSTVLPPRLPARLLAAIGSPRHAPLGGTAAGPSIFIRSVRLEAATIGEIAADDARRRRPGGRQLRILIVEDVVAIADAVKGVLASDGHAVDIVLAVMLAETGV